MDRHEFLRRLHTLGAPRNYFEIGVNDGRSLALSRVRSVAVDPAFKITVPLRCNLELVKATSDEFFAQRQPLRHLRRRRQGLGNLLRRYAGSREQRTRSTIDLAFIDGLHLFEFALRDFMNVERYSEWWSVIVIDDVLPRNIDEAARDRHTRAWAGDVYKLIPVLERYRQDLVLIPVDTLPTGVLLVFGADPRSRVLQEHYDEIVTECVGPDPQPVPTRILRREVAVDPDVVLSNPWWTDLTAERKRGTPRARGYDRLRRELAPMIG